MRGNKSLKYTELFTDNKNLRKKDSRIGVAAQAIIIEVKCGKIKKERIDESVYRILSLKLERRII